MSVLRESPTARFLLRTSVVAAIAVLATLKASVGDGLDAAEWVDIVYAGVGAAAAYAGIGAAVPQVEPFVGNQLEGAQVPSPPADPEPPE